MDIFNDNPRQIRCISTNTHEMMVYSENHHLLKVGQIYTIKDIIVDSWYTAVYLEEFDEPFNSVIFEEI